MASIEGSMRVLDLAASWLSFAALFCLFFHSKTSNSIYPPYWSLYNSLGGCSVGGGSDMIRLGINWVVT
ncbi:MAG: hypothetical protein ACUVV4_04125 [Candidatus Bathyarchaeia archaeon]